MSAPRTIPVHDVPVGVTVHKVYLVARADVDRLKMDVVAAFYRREDAEAAAEGDDYLRVFPIERHILPPRPGDTLFAPTELRWDTL